MISQWCVLYWCSVCYERVWLIYMRIVLERQKLRSSEIYLLEVFTDVTIYDILCQFQILLIFRFQRLINRRRRFFFFWDFRFFEFVEDCVNLELFLQIREIRSDVLDFIAFMTNEMKMIRAFSFFLSMFSRRFLVFNLSLNEFLLSRFLSFFRFLFCDVLKFDERLSNVV
jgi:hypothetical protein